MPTAASTPSPAPALAAAARAARATARPLVPPTQRRAGRPESRIVLRRPLMRADWTAAAGTGAVVALAAGLAAFYLSALWRARDPR